MRVVRLSLVFALWAALSGPALALDLNPFSAIKGAVEAAVEDRSSGDIAKDLEIKAKFTAEVIDKLGTDAASISSDVYEQDVLLTGIVGTDTLKSKAGTLTKKIPGVKTVHNEIRVVKPVDKEKGAVEGFVDDTVIESKINALLLDASGVNVTNFRWRSVHGHVYLFGRALSNAELKKAVGVVKGIKGVQSVTSHVKVRAKG